MCLCCLAAYLVDHPTRVNLTSRTFPHSLPLAFTLPSVPLCHLLGDLLCGYNLVLQLGEFLAPPLPKITKGSVLSLLLNASLFESIKLPPGQVAN